MDRAKTDSDSGPRLSIMDRAETDSDSGSRLAIMDRAMIDSDSGPRLAIVSPLPEVVYTGWKISPITVLLLDEKDKMIESGPMSTLPVEVVVITSNSEPIINQGRRPLLVGKLIVNMQEGCSSLDNLTFTYGSLGNKFQLLVKVHGGFNGVKIREVCSNPFKVKLYQGGSYMMKYPPFADHELWRLDGIAKGGEIDALLNYHQISTVGEFIRRLNSNPTELRGILNAVPGQTWEIIVKHAKECPCPLLDEAPQGFADAAIPILDNPYAADNNLCFFDRLSEDVVDQIFRLLPIEAQGRLLVFKQFDLILNRRIGAVVEQRRLPEVRADFRCKAKIQKFNAMFVASKMRDHETVGELLSRLKERSKCCKPLDKVVERLCEMRGLAPDGLNHWTKPQILGLAFGPFCFDSPVPRPKVG